MQIDLFRIRLWELSIDALENTLSASSSWNGSIIANERKLDKVN